MMNEKIRSVFSSFLILMFLGVSYSWGVFIYPIDNDLNWGRTKISLAVSILLLVLSFFMSIGGYLENKIGLRKTSFLASLLIGLGWVLASFSQKPWHLYLSYSLLVGIGSGILYIVSLSSGISLFPKKRGLVTGFIVFGFGLGASFLSPILLYLINILTWRTTMLISGFFFFIICFLASLFLKKNECSSPSCEIINSYDLNPSKMIKNKNFKLIFASFLIAMIGSMLSLAHIKIYVIDLNYAVFEGVLALSIMSFFNSIGRVIFGFLADKFNTKKLIIILFIILSFALLFVNLTEKLVFIYILSMLIGLVFGGFLILYPALTIDLFGLKYFSINYGVVFISYGIGCFIGPILGAFIHDKFGSYNLAFNISGILSLFGIYFSYLILKNKSINY